jgi:hypothetical protein
MAIGIDGAGGFIDYNDTATSTTPLVLPDGVWVQLTNDGAGQFSNSRWRPYGISQLMHTPSGELDVRELGYGDAIWVRNDYVVTPSVDLSTLQLRYNLGAGAGAYTLEKTVATLSRGAGAAYRQTAETDFIYIGDRNTRQNPITIEVKLTGSDGVCTNYGRVIEVLKR